MVAEIPKITAKTSRARRDFNMPPPFLFTQANRAYSKKFAFRINWSRERSCLKIAGERFFTGSEINAYNVESNKAYYVISAVTARFLILIINWQKDTAIRAPSLLHGILHACSKPCSLVDQNVSFN